MAWRDLGHRSASSAGRLPGPGPASPAGLGLRRSAMEPAPAARRLSRRRLAADFLLVNDEVLRPPVCPRWSNVLDSVT